MAERPEDLNLPNAVITRIIKDALPDGVNVSKEARLAIAKAASVFVLYATSCANNFAMKGKRKTLNAADVLAAIEEMEFDRFTEPLKQNLEAWKKEQLGKKEALEKRKKAKEESNKSTEENGNDADTSKENKEDEDDVEVIEDEENEEGVENGEEEEEDDEEEEGEEEDEEEEKEN